LSPEMMVQPCVSGFSITAIRVFRDRFLCASVFLYHSNINKCDIGSWNLISVALKPVTETITNSSTLRVHTYYERYAKHTGNTFGYIS
jgi:hypothetical protein